MALVAAPPRYELIWCHEPQSRLSPHIATAELLPDFWKRVLGNTRVFTMSKAERYRLYPHWPMPACTGSEYYLLAEGNKLVATGCFAPKEAAVVLGQLRALLRSR